MVRILCSCGKEHEVYKRLLEYAIEENNKIAFAKNEGMSADKAYLVPNRAFTQKNMALDPIFEVLNISKEMLCCRISFLGIINLDKEC